MSLTRERSAEDSGAESPPTGSAPVRVWLTPSITVTGRAVAVTDRTVRVELPWLATSLVHAGQEVRLTSIFRQDLLATVSHMGARGVFLRTNETLPAWIPR